MNTIIAERRAKGARLQEMRECLSITPAQAAHRARMPRVRLESIEAGMPPTEDEHLALLRLFTREWYRDMLRRAAAA